MHREELGHGDRSREHLLGTVYFLPEQSKAFNAGPVARTGVAPVESTGRRGSQSLCAHTARRLLRSATVHSRNRRGQGTAPCSGSALNNRLTGYVQLAIPNLLEQRLVANAQQLGRFFAIPTRPTQYDINGLSLHFP